MKLYFISIHLIFSVSGVLMVGGFAFTDKKDEVYKSDIALINRVISGDERAFEQIVDDCKNMVFSIAIGILKSEQEAEDCAQETFVAAYENIHKFDGRARLSTWIYRIAYNRAIDMLRRRKRRRAVSIDDDDFPEVVDKGVDLSDEVERVDMVERVKGLIDTLPERYREVLYLYYIMQRSYEETAEVMGLPLGTVKTNIHRAKKLLLDKIKRGGFYE
ncbi:MAG TPA: RNA polymerase sigma factor [Firmicutes bacterium]|nr:RNA polymerase sigma factor [Bacillota bacterium]